MWMCTVIIFDIDVLKNVLNNFPCKNYNILLRISIRIRIWSTYFIHNDLNRTRKTYECLHNVSTNFQQTHLDVGNQPDAFFIPETETRINLFSFALYQNIKQKSNRKKKKKKKWTNLAYFQECSFKRLTTLHFKRPPFSTDSLHQKQSS